jgi:hypothetical protein
MGRGEDALRKRCGQMLRPGESILLEAEVQGKVGLLRLLDPGRAYLTSTRIIWLSRKMPLVHLSSWFYRIPDTFSIPIVSIKRVISGKELSRRWLLILTDGQQYTLRLGKTSFFWLRDNPATTDEWLHRIEELREAHRTRIQL